MDPAVSQMVLTKNGFNLIFVFGFLLFHLVKGILRQAMHEMPLITICSPLCVAGVALILYHTYRYKQNDGNNRRYKLKYTRKYKNLNLHLCN